MDLEDAIENAQEKGWSETLVFHEVFNNLREKGIKADQKVNEFYNACICYTAIANSRG